VVASNVGGIPNQIQDGVNGFLVEPTDIETCAEKVVQLLTDREMAEEMGRQAKEFVRENFLITRHMLDYLNLTLDLLGKS
jgi:trehalose synthase